MNLALLLFLPLAAAQDQTYFRDVTVVPMDREPVLRGRTVLVEDGVIVRIEPAGSLTPPPGARVVDGSGRFLMPGLADLHVHIKYEDELTRFVAYGVTTVRNMSGRPMHLRWRDQISRGERIGPTIHSAAPTMDGPPIVWKGSTLVETPEQALRAVQVAHEDGWDYIKVYDSLTREAYAAIVGAARVPVVGHVPFQLDLEEVLASGQHSIEHLFGYEAWLQPDGPTLVGSRPERLRAWTTIDSQRVAPAVRLTVEAGVWNCPTLTMFFQLLPESEFEQAATREEFRCVSSTQLEEWRQLARRMGPGVPILRRGNEARMQLVGALLAGDARIVAGTDTGMPFVPAGLALQWELQRLVEAGATPYEALVTATCAAAECLGSDEFGSVRVGARADLLLLDADPLEDVANVTAIVGVMARGRYHPRRELDRAMQGLIDAGHGSGR